MANSLPKTSLSKPLNTVSTCSSLFIKPVIDEDIIREINLLDNSKCDDTYDIPVKILKLSKNVIAPTLFYLINNCINKGVFLSALKIAKVQWNLAIHTPLYSYNSLFVQHVHTTFDSSFIRCSAIQTHTVIYRAKEDKLQQRSKTFVLVMSTAQCSIITFFVGSCCIPHHVQIIKSLHLNFKQILFCIMLLLRLPI